MFMNVFDQYRRKFLKHPQTRVESAKSGTKVFVCVGRLPQFNQNEQLWMRVLHFQYIRNK